MIEEICEENHVASSLLEKEKPFFKNLLTSVISNTHPIYLLLKSRFLHAIQLGCSDADVDFTEYLRVKNLSIYRPQIMDFISRLKQVSDHSLAVHGNMYRQMYFKIVDLL